MPQTVKQQLIAELLAKEEYQSAPKDIVMVVRDQLDLTKKCIESVFANTEDFKLYLWDNGSQAETADYLFELATTRPNVRLWRKEQNEGFIQPNNVMAAAGSSPYLILLNNDCEVKPGWCEAQLGWLQSHTDTAIVGYEGGLLSDRGMGVMPWNGDQVDYIMAWCWAMPRPIYDKLGLFDVTNLQFAYCEDADLCLRAKEAGYNIYALNTTFVIHHANQTARAVRKEMDLRPYFLANHEYFAQRHADYIKTKRVLLQDPQADEMLCSDPKKTPEYVAADFYAKA